MSSVYLSSILASQACSAPRGIVEVLGHFLAVTFLEAGEDGEEAVSASIVHLQVFLIFMSPILISHFKSLLFISIER